MGTAPEGLRTRLLKSLKSGNDVAVIDEEFISQTGMGGGEKVQLSVLDNLIDELKKNDQ